MRYFISDLHMGHRNVINFERHQFATIEEHNNYIAMVIKNLADKIAKSAKKKSNAEPDEVWILGDFGSVYYLYMINWLKSAGAKTYFVYGNHDKQDDLSMFKEYFDEVYLYPVYLSQKLVVSHYPVAVYNDTINVHGHLHGCKLKDINHVCVSIHVTNYQPLTDRYLDSIYSRLPKFTRRFLYEPWATDHQFTQPKEDVVMDPSGNIDLSASRLLQKLNTERRIQEKDPYQPYHGEGSF